MFKKFRDYRIVPCVSVENADQAMNIAEALAAGGIPVMELMYRTHRDHESIRKIRKKMPDFWIGAGGILNRDLLLRAIDAGARFAVAPGANAETIQEAAKQEFQFAPGICTPTDMEIGLLNGSFHFQFFPAKVSGGEEMLKAIIGPFSHLAVEFMPKGGITRQEVAGYLAIPQVAAVGIEWIAGPDIVHEKKWESITRTATEMLKTFGAKSGK